MSVAIIRLLNFPLNQLSIILLLCGLVYGLSHAVAKSILVTVSRKMKFKDRLVLTYLHHLIAFSL